MRNLFAVSAVCALVALVSSPAEASLVTLTPGTSFTGVIATPDAGQPSCATCSATATFGLSVDGLKLSVSLTNTSTDGVAGTVNLLTAFGFDTTPDIVLPGGKKNDPPTNLAGVAYSGSFTSGWDLTSKGGGLSYELVANTKAGVNGALDGGDTGGVVFTFLNPWNTLSIDAAGVHIQRTAPGNGSKFVCCTIPSDSEGSVSEGEGSGSEGEGVSEGEGAGGEGEGAISEGEGSGEVEGSVPEPASLVLLGIGLTGAATRLRRKA